jgi:hypothetical protein
MNDTDDPTSSRLRMHVNCRAGAELNIPQRRRTAQGRNDRVCGPGQAAPVHHSGRAVPSRARRGGRGPRRDLRGREVAGVRGVAWRGCVSRGGCSLRPAVGRVASGLLDGFVVPRQ